MGLGQWYLQVLFLVSCIVVLSTLQYVCRSFIVCVQSLYGKHGEFEIVLYYGAWMEVNAYIF